MSNSLAAAKRRRAGEQPPMPPPTPSPVQQQQQTQQNRMTLPQVLALLDSRLTKLETQTSSVVPEEVADASKVSINEYISEMDAKFGMLVEEITSLKDIVLKLQTYTMDVNKKLHENLSFKSEISPPE